MYWQPCFLCLGGFESTFPLSTHSHVMHLAPSPLIVRGALYLSSLGSVPPPGTRYHHCYKRV